MVLGLGALQTFTVVGDARPRSTFAYRLYCATVSETGLSRQAQRFSRMRPRIMQPNDARISLKLMLTLAGGLLSVTLVAASAQTYAFTPIHNFNGRDALDFLSDLRQTCTGQ